MRTIQRGLDLIEKGDRLVIAKTTMPYRECLSVQAGRHSGTLGGPFVIVGNGATLDGSTPVPDEAWQHVEGHVFRFQPAKMSHHQLFRDDRPLARVYVAQSSLATLPTLDPLQWCLYRGMVYFCCEEGELPNSYKLTHSTLPTGITLYEVRTVRIENLFVQGYAYDGVNAHDSAMDIELRQLTCRGNGRSGIAVGGSSRVRVDGCLVGANAESQLRVRDYTRVSVAHSRLLGTGDAPSVDRLGGWIDLHPSVEMSKSASERNAEGEVAEIQRGRSPSSVARGTKPKSGATPTAYPTILR